MDHVENARVLDPQAGKLGNVEEATPVDHVAGNPPPGQPEMLALHQRMQDLRVAMRIKHSPKPISHRGGDPAGLDETGAAFRRLEALRQRLEILPAGTQDRRVIFRADREAVMVIGDGEALQRFVEDESEIARREHRAIGLAEEGCQHLALQGLIGRIPVDVEERGIGA